MSRSAPVYHNQSERNSSKNSSVGISSAVIQKVQEPKFPSIEISKPYDFESNFIQSQNMEADPEFELPNLGIDLQATTPLLPYVYYIGSDSPMAAHGQYPASIYYPHEPNSTNACDRIKSFNDFSLLFIFYVHAREKIQVEAAKELKRRNYVYDVENKIWYNPTGQIFEYNTWSFIDPSDYGKISR